MKGYHHSDTEELKENKGNKIRVLRKKKMYTVYESTLL